MYMFHGKQFEIIQNGEPCFLFEHVCVLYTRHVMHYYHIMLCVLVESVLIVRVNWAWDFTVGVGGSLQSLAHNFSPPHRRSLVLCYK